MAESTENAVLDAISIARRYRNGNGSIWDRTVTLLQLVIAMMALTCTLLGALVSFLWSQSHWETSVSDHLDALDRSTSEARNFAQETRIRQEAVQTRLSSIELREALTVQKFETIDADHQRILDAVRNKR